MNGTGSERASSHCPQCDFNQLEALYQLNVEAKRYAESAEDAYTAGLKANARVYSLRKKALYRLKRVILGDLVQGGCVDAVRTHEIDRKAYYCLYVGEFSFHTPTDEWDEPPLNASTSPSKSLDAFDADPDNRTDCLSEREALKQLSEVFETPNNHLETPFVDREYGSEFAGWSYLPGAIEEGDEVDERFKHERLQSDFLFNVGDTFQTNEGRCEILKRYHAWLTPYLDRSPILQREAYDVRLDGEEKETIGQRQIIDDWWVLAERIDDPVPNVDGKLSDLARGHIEKLVDDPIDFEIGDIIELEPRQDRGDPIYCRLTEAHVSGTLLIGQYEPVPPSDEAPLGLSIHEIADDVVAVHDEPPTQE